MLAGLARAQQIGGAITLLQNLAYRQFDRLCILLQIGRVAQHHGRGQDSAQRIGDPFAGDVGSRAVHRLVEVDRAANGR